MTWKHVTIPLPAALLLVIAVTSFFLCHKLCLTITNLYIPLGLDRRVYILDLAINVYPLDCKTVRAYSCKSLMSIQGDVSVRGKKLTLMRSQSG